MTTPPHPAPAPATPAATPHPRRWRRAGAAVAACGLLATLAAGTWWWSGTEGSLATGLRWAQALLPTSMSLRTDGVQGSLRHGGRIGSLQWQHDGLSLDVHALQFQTAPALLLQGQLPLQQVHLERLQGQDQRPPEASAPMAQLVWPWQVDLVWRIDSLHWQAVVPIEASGLQGHYRFDGQAHTLDLDRLQWAQGLYRGHMRLQGRAPMALDAQLQGELNLPASARPRPPLQAQAQLQGTLGGPQAELALHARLAAPGTDTAAPQLTVEGTLQPHAEQPVTALLARLRQIDLAMLWPGAPQTGLNGTVQARPEGQAWRLDVAMDNRTTGPWDRGRVPLERLQAQLLHGTTGWQVQALDARWPGGGVHGQGQWQAPRGSGQWHIERLQPGQWLSTLAGPALSGQLTATQAADGQLSLQAGLQAEGPAAPGTNSGLHIEAHRQTGSWAVPRFELQWADARVQGQGRWTPAEQSLTAVTQWQLPGLSARLEGQLSPRQGQGEWHVESQDTQRLWNWLLRWPALRERLAGRSRPGTLQSTGQWQGGWAGAGLQLQGRIATPDFQAQARTTLKQDKPASDWRGQVDQLQIDWPARGDAPAGQLALQTPAHWRWLNPQRLQWQAHRWALQGPGGPASVAVEGGDWQAPLRTGALPVVHARAQVTGLPLRWAAWFGWPQMQGDLLLQGGLDLQLDERPQLQAWLERQQGDLQVVTDPLQPASRVQAGLRTARARWQVDGQQARLTLDWDSVQAGQLNAQLQSRLDLASRDGLPGLWPATAPLSGQVNARLPRVDAWSWLAPPGWRVQGSLDAQFALSGTRAQPQWTGSLQADNLAVRSAVEGIEFRQGRMRARLQQQQMLLEELRLQGAGPQGGDVAAQGQIEWLPEAGPGLQAVQMDLQMVAKGLRVSNRVDRRLSVSGQVRARMDRGQMQLRGQLQADSAQFILPDNSTPTLGKDVVVLGAATPAASAPRTGGISVIGVPDVQVLLHLGPDFLLHGQGITTRLTGEVQLSSSAATGGQPRLLGQVRTEGGRYQAYGQQLDIEQGLLQFSGPYDNPALDILAVRPNLSQRVGVRVTGTALAPRIRLYADPDMPDADKLAWLVLGRSPAAGGAESAVLQQAALVLLGGNGKGLGGELASALGFDDISLASRSSTTATGTTATGTAVTLGKRLSRDFYLAYESSVSGAFGSLYIFYDLSRKLTLRAQTGEINALDLVYTIRHD